MAELSFDYHNQFETAFNAAAAEGKALLIMWSIDWCPPCNRLKTELIRKDSISQGRDQIVTLYQDGDQPGAQQLAADWYFSSYPTLLLLKPEEPLPTVHAVNDDGSKAPVKAKAKELYRLRGDLSAEELDQALNLAGGNLQPLEDLLNRDFAQFLTKEQWQLLSYVDFLPFKEFLSSDALIQIFKKLVAAVPHSLPTAKAQFASYFLQYISERLDGMAAEYRSKVLPVIEDAITHLGASQQTMYQVRSFLLDDAEGFIATLGKCFPSGAGDVAVTEAAISLRAWAEHLYTEGQLTAAEAQTFLLKKAKINGGQDPVVIDAIEAAANKECRYARNGALSALYASLRHNGLSDESLTAQAEQLLLAQNEAGNHPALYGWKLAYHYLDLGAYAKAEAAMADAVEAAFEHNGEATQLQWLATQFTLGLSLLEQSQQDSDYNFTDTALFAPVDRFLLLADSIPDGYLGRNYRQAFTIYRQMAQHPALKERNDRYADLYAKLDTRIEAASS